MLEMRRFDLVDRLLSSGANPGGRFRKVFIHNINPEKIMQRYNLSSKLNADWAFLSTLRDHGRQYAEEWLNQHYDKIGLESTCNVREVFL